MQAYCMHENINRGPSGTTWGGFSSWSWVGVIGSSVFSPTPILLQACIAHPGLASHRGSRHSSTGQLNFTSRNPACPQNLSFKPSCEPKTRSRFPAVAQSTAPFCRSLPVPATWLCRGEARGAILSRCVPGDPEGG